jgi:hypothetical protein
MWHITGMELWDDDYVSSSPSPGWPRALIRRVRVATIFVRVTSSSPSTAA